eukprot:SAG31_NODE_22548_length_523_cov_0.844340_1_plen_150_part_10
MVANGLLRQLHAERGQRLEALSEHPSPSRIDEPSTASILDELSLQLSCINANSVHDRYAGGEEDCDSPVMAVAATDACAVAQDDVNCKWNDRLSPYIPPEAGIQRKSVGSHALRSLGRPSSPETDQIKIAVGSHIHSVQHPSASKTQATR